MQHEIRYVDWHGHRVCCAVVGEGPHDVVVAGSFVSHLDLLLAHPSVQRWVREVTRYARVVMFDKVGVGLSDPVTRLPTLEDRVDELRTVIHATGLSRPVVLGVSEGAATAIALAATHPQDVTSLALASPFVGRGLPTSGATAEDVLQATVRYFEEAPQQFRPTRERVEEFASVFVAAVTSWGDGSTLGILVPSLGSKTQLALLERSVASPAMVRAAFEAATGIDAIHLAGQVRVPTLVVHAREDVIPIEAAREVASRIPTAELIEVDGPDHAPWLNVDGLRSWGPAFESFVTGHTSGATTDRVLATVLFADLVASTRRAAELGDQRWRSLLESFQRGAAEAIAGHGGRLVKDLGDGLLATFASPLSAVRAGERLAEVALDQGLEARVGAHTGEIEVVGDDIAGLAVHIASRVMALAEPSQVLTTRTVRDLVAGSGVQFISRGRHVLRDVPDEWELMAVSDEQAPATIAAERATRWYDRMLRSAARRRIAREP